MCSYPLLLNTYLITPSPRIQRLAAHPCGELVRRGGALAGLSLSAAAATKDAGSGSGSINSNSAGTISTSSTITSNSNSSSIPPAVVALPIIVRSAMLAMQRAAQGMDKSEAVARAWAIEACGHLLAGAAAMTSSA